MFMRLRWLYLQLLGYLKPQSGCNARGGRGLRNGVADVDVLALENIENG
jgi:hypothetical protein